MDIGNQFDLSGDTAERVRGAKIRKNFECKAVGPGIDWPMSSKNFPRHSSPAKSGGGEGLLFWVFQGTLEAL